MIEDVIAQSHVIIDSLQFKDGTVALSALRTLNDSPSQAGPFAQMLGITFTEFGDGRCSARLDVKEHLLNPHGIAHGGATFSLADSACGGAALSVLDSPRIVTQDMQIRYHGPARPGTIQAQAEVVHHGRRTITTRCQVTQHEILIASITATFAILSDVELGEVQNGAN